MFIKQEENTSTDCVQTLSSDRATEEGTSTTTAPSSSISPSKNEHGTTMKLPDQPQNVDTKKEDDASNFGTTSEQVPMSLPLQDDLCINAMEATIQSVFDALNVLSQQQQHPQHSQLQHHSPLPAAETGLGASHSSSSNTSAATASAILAQISLPSSTVANPASTNAMTLPSSRKNGGSNISPGNPYPVMTHQPVVTETPELSPAEQLKQQMMKQKVRSDNRERKQRWRINNEERNKDNDLRCRVNKRAQKLFGMEPSDHKKKWVDEEFERRRAKRQEKERRKQAVNGALAATHSPTTPMTEESDPTTISQLQHKLLQHYQSLFGMDQQDSEKTKNSTAALVAALQNPQLLQLSQLLAQSVSAGSVPPHQPSPQPSLPPHSQPITSTPSSSILSNDPSPSFLAIQQPSLLTAPREDNDDNKDDNRMDLDQSKIDLAASEIMKQFTSHALGTQLDPPGLGESSSTPSEAATPSTNTTTGAPASTTDDTMMEGVEKESTRQGTEKKNDYPMDAVMTLMELNAGWRP